MLVCTDTSSCTHGDYDDILDKILKLLLISYRRASSNTTVLWQTCRHQTHILQKEWKQQAGHIQSFHKLPLLQSRSLRQHQQQSQGKLQQKGCLDDILQLASFMFLPQPNTNGGQSRVHQNHDSTQGVQTVLSLHTTGMGASAISAWFCWGLSGETRQNMF